MIPSGFDILYEEGPCLVVAKPGGLLTQAPPGIDSLEIRIKDFLKQRDHKPGKVYLGVPHRLDRPVSGALVVARHVRAARRLSEQFEGRMVGKAYWACVEGHLLEEQGTWQDYLRKVPGEARAEVVSKEHADARAAVLHFQVHRRTEASTLLEIQLETGRTHQIRVQAASRGHAVLGDLMYGAVQPFGPLATDPRDRWIALHARSLRFRHPMTREWTEVTAPFSDHWKNLNIDGCLEKKARD